MGTITWVHAAHPRGHGQTNHTENASLCVWIFRGESCIKKKKEEFPQSPKVLEVRWTSCESKVQLLRSQYKDHFSFLEDWSQSRGNFSILIILFAHLLTCLEKNLCQIPAADSWRVEIVSRLPSNSGKMQNILESLASNLLLRSPLWWRDYFGFVVSSRQQWAPWV